MTLEIKGFWHEEDAPVKDVDFVNALAKGLVSFAKFVGAKRVKTAAIQPVGLRKHIQAVLKTEME